MSQIVGAIGGAPKDRLLASGGFVPQGLPEDYWSAMEPPLHAEVAEVVLGASHAYREPPDEVGCAHICCILSRSYPTGTCGVAGIIPGSDVSLCALMVYNFLRVIRYLRQFWPWHRR